MRLSKEVKEFMKICIELEMDHPTTFKPILRSLLRDLQRTYPQTTGVKKLLIHLEERIENG